jgi:hypothetical protein
MPYIITTYLPGGCLDPVGAGQEPDACHAVATLDEALGHVSTTVCDLLAGENFGQYQDEFRAIGEAGGTFGPLPDGTTVEVEQVNWNRLADLASYDPLSGATGSRLAQAILDAYNKEHA